MGWSAVAAVKAESAARGSRYPAGCALWCQAHPSPLTSSSSRVCSSKLTTPRPSPFQALLPHAAASLPSLLRFFSVLAAEAPPGGGDVFLNRNTNFCFLKTGRRRSDFAAAASRALFCRKALLSMSSCDAASQDLSLPQWTVLSKNNIAPHSGGAPSVLKTLQNEVACAPSRRR